MPGQLYTEFSFKSAAFDLVFVEGGIYDMGDEHGDLWSACSPVHPVRVSDFFIGKYPVTQALWKAVMDNENPSFFKGDDRPVEQVSWDDTRGFIQKLNEKTSDSRPAGYIYRLPTEAQWEYAARGGKLRQGYKYSGSNKLKEVGWFDDNSHGETKPVGLKCPNELGLYDMSGNVYEWCQDWHDSSYYEKCKEQGLVENPEGPKSGSDRVIRGGGWDSGAQGCRAASRFDYGPDIRGDDVGFRLALSLQSVG